jgi:hypothetical protein
MTMQETQAWLDQMRAYDGRAMLLELDGAAIKFSVQVQDCKTAYGKVRALIVPVSGEGSAWVNANRLEWREAETCVQE